MWYLRLSDGSIITSTEMILSIISMQPLFPWTGTKRRLAARILAGISPRRILEPFAGGAALYFHAELPGVLIDINQHLVSLYNDLRSEPGSFLRALEDHVAQNSERHFYETRFLLCRGKLSRFAGAATMYLLLACRNGLWREDRAGYMNTPYGHRPSLSYNREHLLRASTLLKSASIYRADWHNVQGFDQDGDLVFFDPPYSRGFNSYSNTPFDDWTRLLQVAVRCRNNGAYVAITNYRSSGISDLFAGWRHVVIPSVKRHNPKHPHSTEESLFLSY